MRVAVCGDSRKDREILLGLLRKYRESNGFRFEIAEYDSE